jgi:VWFA-related protein
MKHKSVALKSIILFAFAIGSLQALAQQHGVTSGMGVPMEVPSRQQMPLDRKPLTFSAKAQYVLVPVIVLDKSKTAVKGLKKEDFTVLENGKSQPISSVEEVNTTNAAIKQNKELSEFSNSFDSGGQAHKITIIVLDMINTPLLDQTYARRSIIKMLANAPDDGSLIELLAIHAKGITVVHSFTDNPKSLIAAMKVLDSNGNERFKDPHTANDVRAAMNGTGLMSANAPGGVSPTTLANYSSIMNFASGADDQYVIYQRDAAIGATLQAFQRIAGSVESVPGRKSLIWVTDGFPFYIDSDSSELVGSASYNSYERTMQVLDNANVAVYPVDSRGLVGIHADDSSRYAVGDVNGTESQVDSLARDHNATLTTFRDVADMTGGQPFFNNNDIGSLVKKSMDDSTDYYMLSYPLNKANTQAGWRKIEVKVKGYKAHSREGFFVTRATLEQADSRQPDLDSALASPLEFTSLPIKAKWLGDPLQGQKGKIVQFELDLPGSAISPEDNGNKVSLDFRVAAIDPQGQPKGDVKQTFEGTLPPAGAEQLKKDGVQYKNSLELAPGEYTIHFVVRDNTTGKVGSVIAQLKVG